jgi:putative flippase GtrA
MLLLYVYLVQTGTVWRDLQNSKYEPRAPSPKFKIINEHRLREHTRHKSLYVVRMADAALLQPQQRCRGANQPLLVEAQHISRSNKAQSKMISEEIEPLAIERTTHDGVVDSTKRHRSSRRLALASAIRWLESLRVPKCLRKTEEGAPIIAGLERVCFGTQPAAETVTILGASPPRYLCYMLSGSGCDIIQFGIDLLLHLVFHLEDPSLCWALGFGISVSFRHTTHRYLVFGDYVGGYWASLGRMYAGYSIIIVLSTLFNFVMTRNAHLSHYIAWVITLLWTGIVNYFILKKLWTVGGKEKSKENSPSAEETDLENNLSPSKRAGNYSPRRSHLSQSK